MGTLADPAKIRLLVAGPDLKPLAPVTKWDTITATVTQNQAGSGEVTLPPNGPLFDLLSTSGNRLHLYYDGRPFLCGLIEQTQEVNNSGVPDPMTFNWTNDIFWLASRITYPSPTKASDAQDLVTLTLTDVAETVMRQLVDTNAGPGALSSRQIPHLVMGAANSPLVGSTISESVTISQNLTDVLRDAATIDNLTFDVVLNDTVPQLEFVVRAPRDVSKLVRYTPGLNNLNSLTVTTQAPTATVAIVAQEGDSTDTTSAVGLATERTNTDGVLAWGRMEVYVSSTADTSLSEADQLTQMQADGDQELVNDDVATTVTADVVDTPKRMYGVAYQLGDTVGIQPVLGPAITETVTAVTLNADSQAGVTVVPTLGDGNAQPGKAMYQLIHELQRRISRLEGGH